MQSEIDCVVVGYREFPVDELLESAANFQEGSGTYRHLLANTVKLNGKRVKYTELFNRSATLATGRAQRYNVANVPNLGAVYLTSFLRERGFTAELVNFVNENKQELESLLQRKPRLVAITTTFYVDGGPIRAIIDLIRSYQPDVRIVVGGPHIFNLCATWPDERAQNGRFRAIGADYYIVDSQGERTLSQLCDQLRQGTPDLSVVPNLAYTNDRKTFVRTRREIENNNLDECAINWRRFPADFVAPIATIRTARSCAFKCSFCRYPVLGGPLNLGGLDVVEHELNELADIGVTHLLIIDDTFNVPRPRFKELCRLMIRNQYRFNWFSYFRCGNADDESFDLIAEAGCKGVFLGIESADRAVLRNMDKGATPERYAYGINKLNEREIISYASFIIGFPGETEESARRTREFIQETKPTYYSMESFYYDATTPIGAKAETFSLTGQAYSWTHATMDWKRASEIVQEAYRSITGSTLCPNDGVDLWTIAYLMAHGYSKQAVANWLRLAAKALVDGIDGDGEDASSYLPELAATLKGFPLPKSALAERSAPTRQMGPMAGAGAAAHSAVRQLRVLRNRGEA